MEMKSITLRKQVGKCKKCGNPKFFIYLSDFAYGHRMAYLNKDMEFAVINLLEDEHYDDFINTVRKVIAEENRIYSEKEILRFAHDTYGITCDAIRGQRVDFSASQKKCTVCGSVEFEKYLIEPESLVQMEVSIISHEIWAEIDVQEREKLIRQELESRGTI